MVVSRRVALLGVAAFGLSGCGRRASVAASPRVPDDLQPVRNANYDAWVRGFRARAANQGISQSTLDAGFRGAGYLPGVVKRDRNQTEFNRTLEDYLAIAASDERVTKGRAALARHRGTLNAIEAKYGVPAQIVAAIWGLESFFGERRGDVSVVAAELLSNLVFEDCWSCGDLALFGGLDAVFECDAGDDFGEVVKAA